MATIINMYVIPLSDNGWRSTRRLVTEKAGEGRTASSCNRGCKQCWSPNRFKMPYNRFMRTDKYSPFLIRPQGQTQTLHANITVCLQEKTPHGTFKSPPNRPIKTTEYYISMDNTNFLQVTLCHNIFGLITYPHRLTGITFSTT